MFNTITKNTTLFLAVVAFAAFLPLAQSHAEETETLESLRARIAELETEVADLKADLLVARGEVKTVQTELDLARTLFLGTQGDDVKSLQEWLAQYKDIYPEGIVSGYYGPLTEKAVKRFQQRHGIEQVGTVGPQTREKIRVMMTAGASLGDVPAGLAKKVTLVEDDDDDSSDLYELTGKGKTVLCRNGKTLTVAISALRAQIRGGAIAGACETEKEKDDDEDEDAEALEIDDVYSENITDEEAEIVWSTNNKADSLVWYSLEEDVYADEDKMHASDSDLVKDHLLTLTDLTADTTYYYFVVSEDENDDTATSSVKTFVTDKE